MTTSIKFELAKLLKEKNFNLPCRYHYYTWLGKYEIIDNEEFATNEELSIQAKNDNISLDTWITAPTIAEVVMWLYENFGIWISVDMDDIKEFYSTVNGFEICFGKINPAEAYEAAIEYCLINLI